MKKHQLKTAINKPKSEEVKYSSNLSSDESEESGGDNHEESLDES